MTNILRSNIKRMLKHPALWVCAALQIVLTFIVTVKYATTPVLLTSLSDIFCMEETFFGFALIEIMSYVMCTLIVGGDYNNKTIRNKIILGYTREQIFFAQFLTALTATLVVYAVRLLFFCAFSLPVLKTFDLRREYLLAVFVITLFSLVMYSSFVTFVLSLTQSMTRTLVICIACFLIVMFLFATMIPRDYDEAKYAAHSIISKTDYAFNDWSEGKNGDFYKFMYEFFPSGQSQLIYQQAPLCLWQILLYLGLQIAAFLTGGALIFRFRNLK